MTIEEAFVPQPPIAADEWKTRYSNRPIPRPRFMTVADYVFYLRRHLVAEQRKNDPNVGYPGDESMQIGIPKLPYLLKRLEDDIRSSYTSFVEEFVSDAHNGAGYLLDLLRTCHNRPSESGLFPYGTCVRRRQNLINMRTIDELYCLLCLKAASKSATSVHKMTVHTNGILTLASCIMSYHTKSRILAIELLTAACRVPESGVSRVLEAMTAVRMIFGESVRFKCLVSILNSSLMSSSVFEITTLNFLNTLLENCSRVAERIRIQCELEEAGLDMKALEKDILQKTADGNRDRVWSEIQRFNRLHLDLKNALQEREDNVRLRKEVLLLRKACKKLQEEKRELMSVSKELQNISAPEETVKPQRTFCPVNKMDDPSASVSVNPSAIQDSELEEIFIDIPTIATGENSDLQDAQNRSLESRPLPTPPIQKHSDSGISSIWGSDADMDLALGWQYPEIPTLRLVKRQSSVHVRFSNEASSIRPSRSSALGRVLPDVLVLPPGRNRTKYADVNGVANSGKEKVQAKGHQEARKMTNRSQVNGKTKKPEKRRLDSTKTSYEAELPKHGTHSLKIYNRQVSQSAKGSKSPYNLTLAPIGSSISGMIHREIARAIRDRSALFEI